MINKNNIWLAVYQGAQVSDQNIKFDWYDYDSMRWRTGIFTNTVEFPTHNFDKVGDGLIHRNAVFMFPAEYNTYGNESAPIVSWRTNSKGALQKVYRVFNNQDTPILEMTNENFRTVNPLPLELKTYGPYGEDVKYSSFTSLNETNNRIGYIGKETDSETGLSDHGVRKYNKNNGRFLTTDPLWEKYPFWNPYQYCMNNPVSFVDGGGMFVENKDGTPKVFTDKKGQYLIGNDKRRIPLETTVYADCIGYAFAMCNGKGPMGFDLTKNGNTKVYDIAPAFAKDVAESEGYSKEKNLKGHENEVKKGDVLLYYDAAGIKHAAVATGERDPDNGDIIVTEVQGKSGSKSVKLTLTKSKEKQNGAKNVTFITPPKK